MRLTRQHQLVEEIFEQADGPLNAQEVWELAREHMPSIGQATVYRQVQAALERGQLRQVEMPGKSARYEKSTHAHRHYFVCRGCESFLPLKGCPGSMQGLVPDGCQVHSHEVILYGACHKCK